MESPHTAESDASLKEATTPERNAYFWHVDNKCKEETMKSIAADHGIKTTTGRKWRRERKEHGNVPHGLAAHPGWRPTFAKPPPKPPHSDAKQPTLALYRTIQPKISFRVYFYCLLTRTRIMPGLTAPSTPPLRWFTCFSAHSPL
jgi:hypothetical protein